MSHPTAQSSSGDPFAEPSANRDKPAPLHDLPPVEAPSAGFVVQLFVIPAAVVVVVIIVWLLFGKLAGGEHNPMEYVRQLRLPTANWRSAYELASLIQNDPTIAADPKLVGELTDLFSHELDRIEDPKQQEDPRLAQYLALTMGSFRTLDGQTLSGQVVEPARSPVASGEPEIRQEHPDLGGGQSGPAGGPRGVDTRRPPRGQRPRGDGRGREPADPTARRLRPRLLRRPEGRAGPPRPQPLRPGPLHAIQRGGRPRTPRRPGR